MNTDNLTIKEAREIAAMFGAAQTQLAQHPYTIGANYLIRTVTNYFTGKLISVYAGELVLDSAAWIADTGRFADAIASGAFDEVEPMGDGVIVSRGSIVDAKRVTWPLPTEQK